MTPLAVLAVVLVLSAMSVPEEAAFFFILGAICAAVLNLMTEKEKEMVD